MTYCNLDINKACHDVHCDGLHKATEATFLKAVFFILCWNVQKLTMCNRAKHSSPVLNFFPLALKNSPLLNKQRNYYTNRLFKSLIIRCSYSTMAYTFSSYFIRYTCAVFQGALTPGNPYHAWGRLTPKVQRSVPCSSTTRFVGPGTVGGGGLQYSTDAHARAQAQSADFAVTVCGRFTLNSGRQ